MYIPCEASSWTLLHQNRKLSSRISLQNQLFCLCRLPAVIVCVFILSIWLWMFRICRFKIKAFLSYLIHHDLKKKHSWLGWLLWDLCHKWPRICSTYVNTSRFFPHSWHINGFVTRLTRRVPLVEHLSSPPVFSGFVLRDL